MRIRRTFAGCAGSLLLAGLFFALPRRAEAGFLEKLFRAIGIGGNAALSEETIVAGLREALTVGTGNTVKLTGAVDGYFANAAIKILLPEEIRKAENALRLVGYGPKLDEFVLSMNRAAEKAAPLAREPFLDAVRGITFDDARKLLAGGDTAITDFFRSKTRDSLLAAFAPVVEKALAEFDVTAKYTAIVKPYRALPFAEKMSFLDINSYVVAKGLDGLFHMLGEQEREIRRNPAARVTELLRQVFK